MHLRLITFVEIIVLIALEAQIYVFAHSNLLKSVRAISITRLAHYCLPPVTYQRGSLPRPSMDI